MYKRHKQRIGALSTTEDEFIAVVDAFKEQKAVQNIIEETKHVDGPCRIDCDIQETSSLEKNTSYSGGAKHIEISYVSIQDVVKRREI